MGQAPISLGDVAHWQSLMGVDLNPWEIETILSLDRVAMKAAADQQAKQK